MISPLMAVGTRRLLSRPSMLYRPSSLLGFPSTNFSTATKSFCWPPDNYFTPVDAIQDSSYPDFSTMTLNLSNQVEIRFKKDTKLQYFHEQLTSSENNKVQDAEFYTVTGSRIPLSETISDLQEYPILL